MKMTQIETLADELRKTWNGATGTNEHQTRWEIINERANRGYLAVAEKAVELCSEKKYRSLTTQDTIQLGDEVWAFGTGPWQPVTPTEYGQKFQLGYNAIRREVNLSDYKQQLQATAEERDRLFAENADLRTRLENALSDKVIAEAAIRDIKDVNADQRVQIKHLEQQLAEQLTAKNSWMKDATKAIQEWSEMKKSLDICQKANRDHAGEIADKDARIRRLKEKLENCAPPIIDWKGQHDTIKCLADAKISELQDKLEKADTYISGLESDLSTIDSVAKNWQDIKVTKNGETHPLGTLIPMLESQIAATTRERDNWMETAAQFSCNADFYHGIVTDIGEMFGLRARLTEYGTISEYVVASTLPELVAKLIIKSEEVL